MFVLSLGFAAYIFILRTRGQEGNYDGSDEILSERLCNQSLFLSFRRISAVFCVIFGTIFLIIRKKSRAIEIITDIDKIN